ncbi:MAG: L-fuculose-phosphate aldolase [Miltoncostaeaceae bacterium]|jgi:L-fuculose-phosphate aldolase|nr:L-fuculose-phosphate aldolase [Miltoncostaeaceae bacterium]
MRLRDERDEVARLARRLRPDGLVVGTAGNLSARRGDLVAITPSGLDYDDLDARLVCVVDLDGTQLDGLLAPSLELPMHLACYRRAGAGAVVHSHSPFATAVSLAQDELPAVHYLIGDLGGPVRVAPYATFGTEALADGLVEALEGRSAALLASHGVITIGDTLARAYDRSLILESIAAAYVRAKALGEPRVIPDAEVAVLVEKMADYGQVRPA